MNILIASSIFPDAIEELRKDHDVVCAFGAPDDELKERIRDRDVAILRSGVNFSADVMSCAPNLRLMIRAGSGFDNIDMGYVEKSGIHLVRVPEPGAKAVAEMAFTMMLALSRQLFWADKMWRAGHWVKPKVKGFLLTGKTLGVIGAGSIGARVGRMGAAWGMNAIGCVDPPTDADARRLEECGMRMVPFDEVISTSDYLSVHVPLMDSTRNLIDAGVIARMKPGAFLVNLARGGVVNEAALREALQRGHVAGAGMDVHEKEGEGNVSPLADLSNVILTPHIGAGTVDSQREIGERVLEIVASFVAGHTDGSRVMTKKTTQFKNMLTSPEVEFLMEAHNGASAKIVQETGFRGIWASGLCMSAAMGVRDNNEASWTQVLEVLEFMSDATEIPILVDADTGYGNFNNVRRFVAKLEQRGIAAMCIEDKLFPKTNSFIDGSGQPLADMDEFCGKIKAAKDSQTDSDFCVVARVEALIAGWGQDEALRRAEAYHRAGADAVLIHSKINTADEIFAFMKEWKNTGPVVIVPTMYHQTPTAEFEKAGISLVIWANQLMRAAVRVMQETAAEIHRNRTLVGVEEKIVSVKEIFRLQNAAELKEAEKVYLPQKASPIDRLLQAQPRTETARPTE